MAHWDKEIIAADTRIRSFLLYWSRSSYEEPFLKALSCLWLPRVYKGKGSWGRYDSKNGLCIRLDNHDEYKVGRDRYEGI